MEKTLKITSIFLATLVVANCSPRRIDGVYTESHYKADVAKAKIFGYDHKPYTSYYNNQGTVTSKPISTASYQVTEDKPDPIAEIIMNSAKTEADGKPLSPMPLF